MTVLEAMAREEGFYKPGTRAERNHNPGNIEYGKFARAHGATGTDGRFAIFANADAGFAAMKSLLLSAYANQTLEQALNHYAPPVENDTNTYLARVCLWAKVDSQSLVKDCMV